MNSIEFAAMLKTEESRRAIIEIVVADLKANGPIKASTTRIVP